MQVNARMVSTKDLLNETGKQICYVGSSRARFKLVLIANLSVEESNEIMANMEIRKTKKPGKALAAAFNAKYKEVVD